MVVLQLPPHVAKREESAGHGAAVEAHTEVVVIRKAVEFADVCDGLVSAYSIDGNGGMEKLDSVEEVEVVGEVVGTAIVTVCGGPGVQVFQGRRRVWGLRRQGWALLKYDGSIESKNVSSSPSCQDSDGVVKVASP